LKSNNSAFSTFAIIFLKELKHVFRDKDVVIYTLIVPAVIYPMLLIFAMELFIMKSESDSNHHVKYAVSARAQTGSPRVRVVDDALSKEKHYTKVSSADQHKDLMEGRIDFILDEEPVKGQSGQVVAIMPRSMLADHLVASINSDMESGYKKALNQAFEQKGLGESAIQVNKIEQKNLNVKKTELFSMALALLFFSLLTVALGAAYPAIAATSEEFERNTIEACIVLPVNRWFFTFAKLMAVVSLATLAGALNLFSMGADSSLVLLGAGTVKGTEMLQLDFKLSPDQVPIVVLAYLSVCFIYSALLLLCGAFCRTVRSSQQWISLPLTAFMLVPVIAVLPNISLTKTTAWIPILNNLLVLRSLFNGEAFGWLHLISFVEAIIIIAITTKVVSVLVYEGFEDKWRF